MEEHLGRRHAKKETERYKPILLKKTFHTLRQIVPVAEVTKKRQWTGKAGESDMPINAWHLADTDEHAFMNPATYHVIHLVLTLVLAISGLASWRIYYRHVREQLPDTSAWAMMKRLRSEGDPDGTWILVTSGISTAAGIGLLVLLNVR